MSEPSSGFTGDTIATDSEGRFRFSNLPCYRDYVVTASMESVHHLGAPPVVVASVGGEESVTNAPTLRIEPGRRLSGRVTVAYGLPMPPGTIVRVAHRGDSRVVPLDSLGRFEVDGLPSAEVTLTVIARGHHLLTRTPRLWTRRDNTVGLAMFRDRADVNVILEPDELRVDLTIHDYLRAPIDWNRPYSLHDLLDAGQVTPDPAWSRPTKEP